MCKLIDISSEPVFSLLKLLLLDKTTKKNIIWATDTYKKFGEGFFDKEEINEKLLLYHIDIIKPRIEKSLETQSDRTRKRAEVFTPARLCNKMNNYLDEEWFGRKAVFNIENSDNTWTVVDIPIKFSETTWQNYIDSRRLEITCGEAPYLVSRYDVATGEFIKNTKARIGQLDRKLRIVNENTYNRDEWLKWTVRAFEACYGYEYQGDNLLIARINLFLTFLDHYRERWDSEPDEKLMKTIANIIVYNIWQMDGLKGTVPLGKLDGEYNQISFCGLLPGFEELKEEKAIDCRVYNWRSDRYIVFRRIGDKSGKKKLFDYVIGNPPYQESQVSTSDKPVYNYFLDEAYKVGKKAEFITPARFLFNAGKTAKSWNKKMLTDVHFKVLNYESDATSVFPATDIKGGVAITYRDESKDFGAIQIFVADFTLSSILHKVRNTAGFRALSEEVYAPEGYKFTKVMYQEHPDIKKLTFVHKGRMLPLISKGHDYDLTSNIFEKLDNIVFFEKKPSDGNDYIRIEGRKDNKRCCRWIKKAYIAAHENLDKYKMLFPKANGSGRFGEEITMPLIAEPNEGHTQTFISIGKYSSKEEVENEIKYIKTRFARAMLGILKVTQDNKKAVWQYVPIQDFTLSSDIDWSKPIHEIDIQLYKKYGLDKKEVEFIEKNVKGMY